MLFFPSNTNTSTTQSPMGKSIRSKSKRHFRSILRASTYKPAQRKRQMEALSNLRRSIGNQTANKDSVESLRALLTGQKPAGGGRTEEATNPHADGVLPDASAALGLSQWKMEMDDAEKERLELSTGHFHFKAVAAPDYQEAVLWKTSVAGADDNGIIEKLLKEREMAANGMVIDTNGSSQASLDMAKRQREAKRLKTIKRKRSKNTLKNSRR